MPPPATRLQFEIQVEDGSGLLLLRPRTLFGWLQVERLELQIPKVSFPLDITDGMAQFRAQRCRVAACALRIDPGGLDELLSARAAPLQAAGFSLVRARLWDGAVELGGVARVGGDQAELVVRAEAHFLGRAVELRLSEVHLLGLLRRPAWLLAHDLLSVLLGAGSSEGETLDETAPLAVGLGRVRLVPLELFLARALPAAGWKVPSAEGVRPSLAALDAAGARLVWTTDGAELPRSEETPPEPTEAGDAALLRSDFSGAAAAYRAASDSPLATHRLLSVLLARDSTLKEAVELARQTLARRPGWMPALLALSAALARESPDAAAEASVAALASVAEGSELSLRLARAAARLHEPERAVEFHERVLRQSPGDAEAKAALSRHHQASAAAVTDPGRAHELLEQAVTLDGGNAAAWAALARLRAAASDLAGAVTALEQLVTLAPEARTHAQLSSLREQLGQLDAAQASSQRAVELSPEEPDLWAQAARLAERRGDGKLAGEAWARLVALAPNGAERRAAEESLLKLAVAHGDLDEAHRWRDTARHPPPPALLLELAQKEEAAGDFEDALRTLGAALERLPSEEAARAELSRSRLCRALGRHDDARAAWRAAFRRAPDSIAGGTALRALAQDARATGDAVAEAGWLDELLQREASATWSQRRGELHAAAGEWERARARLEEARPTELAARRLYAEALGQLGDVRARAESLTLLAAEDPSLWIAAVNARLDAKDTGGAAEALAAAARFAPEDPAVRVARGRLAWERRDWDEVIATYPSLLELSAGRELARDSTRLGLALERRGDLAEARGYYRRSIAEADAGGEELATAWRRVAELEERAGASAEAAAAWAAAARDPRVQDPRETVAEKHRRAAELYHRRLGRGAQALDELRLALHADPAHLPSLDLLESIHLELGDDDGLAATLWQNLQLLIGDPRRHELVRRLAELETRRGNPDGALRAWQSLLEWDPADADAVRFVAEGSLASRDVEAAARCAALLPSSGLPDDQKCGILTQLANLLTEGNRFEEAERALAAVLACNPRDRPELAERRVRLLLDRLVDPLAALAAARTELALAPHDLRLLALTAEIAAAADEPAVRAEALVRLSESAEPLDERTRLLLDAAELYSTRLDDSPRAQLLYDQVLKTDPTRLPPEPLKRAAEKARGRADELVLLTALRESGGAGVDELTRLAQLHLAAHRLQPAAQALADALSRHVDQLQAQGQPLDDRGRALLTDLSAAAAASGDHASLVRGLERAASIEPDAAAAASSLGEAALLMRTQLGDPAGAAELLELALQRRPDSALLLADFEAIVRTLDDPARLRRAYQAHLETLSGMARAPILTRLVQLCSALGDDDAASQHKVELIRWEPPRATPPTAQPPPDPGRGRALFLAVADTPPAASAPGHSGPELLAAIAALRSELDALPAHQVEAERSLRLKLAWMYRRAGDAHSAYAEFERLSSDEPQDRTLLAALVETSLLDERWRDAAAGLDRLQRLTEPPEERAQLVCRMGEVYRLQLGDEERAAEEYLRAVDLDPMAQLPLWRLVDYYFARKDDDNLIDIARALDGIGALAAPEAEPHTQARAWVALALDAFEAQRESLKPPPELESELRKVLGELAERPQPPSSLAAAARRLALAAALGR